MMPMIAMARQLMSEATIPTTDAEPNYIFIFEDSFVKVIERSFTTWWCFRCKCGGGADGAGSGGGDGGVDGGADSADGGGGGGWVRIRPDWFCEEVILDQLVENVKWS